jgi:tetratricopeptide (TPR) repeat protein
MPTINQIFGNSIAVLIFLTACNSNEDNSPFSNIYQLPELKPISDSILQFPKNDELYYRRANLVLTINNKYTDAAIYDMQKAWSIKQTPDYATDLGYLLLRNKPDSAIAFLKRATRIFPDIPELNYSLAEAYLAAKKPDSALLIHNSILNSDTSNKYFLEKKALLLLKLDRKMEAISILEKLYNSGSKNVSADLAFLLAETKNPGVLSLADDMIRSDTADEHAEPYYFKGVYYYNIGDKAKAIELFTRAIQNDKYFMDAWLEKGKTQFELNQLDKSRATFEKIIEISPDNADAFYWLGKCAEASGSKEEAKLNYQKAYALDKTLTEAKEAMDRIIK